MALMRENDLEEFVGGEGVDLLIIGGTGAGVSLALAARAAGVSVFLAGSRPYLGEDICGDMLYWLEPGEVPQGELSKRIYGSGDKPPTPMSVKLCLEQALVEAGIPFLLNCHAAGPVRDKEGRIAGARLVTRSGFTAMHARVVVDATTEGTLARLSGVEMKPHPTGRQWVVHTTLCQGGGQDADSVELVTRPQGFAGVAGGQAYSLSARTYRLEVDFGTGSLRDMARAEAEIVERCYVPGEFQHQERVRVETTDCTDSGDQGGTTEYTELTRRIPIHDGMCVLSPMGLTEGPLRRILRRPVPAIDFAAGLGNWVLGKIQEREIVTINSGKDNAPIAELESCDVLVLGGGTGGAPAAIAASRKGADTIVVEATDQLGGVGTVGQIARYWFGNKVGFTEEIDEGVFAMETDPVITARKGQWSVAAKSEWYHRQCVASGATLVFRSICCGVETREGRVTGLLVATPYGFGLIRAKCVVDASGCAEVAAAAGAPTRRIEGEHVAIQGTGLAGIVPGRDYHNTDHNFSDDTDVRDTTAFFVASKLKFRDQFDAGQLVDSRERRQIIGEIVLGPSDFLSDRRYPDTICVASSNFDTHGFTIHPVFMVKPPHKKRLWADVPFRALLARGLERVLTTGLGLSAHRDALPVIRMQADVQNHGYASGYVAAMSALDNVDLRELPMKNLQRHLIEMGNLPDRVLTDVDNFPVSEERLRAAIGDELDEHEGLALLFAEAERSRPLLRKAFSEAGDERDRQVRIALILALMDDATGEETLREKVASSEWDTGWNYTGMGQFGMSLSELDSLIIALGRVGDNLAWPVLLEKMKALPPVPDFSHCRAVAEACEGLYPRFPDLKAAQALASVLTRPGISGHAQTSLQSVQASLTDDPEETGVRNAALRELHLARALYRCGDLEGLGEKILQQYSRDFRGHFASHAKAVLG